MQVCKYGIELRQLSEEDLELVRLWRNSDHVRMNMSFQQEISPEMQRNWFTSLNPSANIYFLILKDGKKTGVVNLKNIEKENGSAEAGIFIGQTEYLNTIVPVLATVTIMEFAFQTLSLKTLKAKINRENANAILFNQSIGYKKTANFAEEGFEYYEVNEIDFLECTRNIRDTLNRLNEKSELLISSDEIKLFGIREENCGMPLRLL